ncbi:hypothetical protein N0V88_001477 [Collariella sp. IMI 366227]|nr:hypothetical protein N0V88_001477 [Collariella sp. IMI 366227]
MNRFRTKKRAKDDLASSRASEEADQSSLSFFRKGKKVPQEEVKKEFDLSSALPSNDDFRTSLLMSNLSARFSMLREQDDPNSKIGKASDDSVLHPRRQSRLADFGFSPNMGGLSDIAEVESVRGSNYLRTTSMVSDDPDGSVMNRARPTEGNNLFGGRQKIYKIPATSGGGMAGRAVYDDDVALSSFQRWRQQEREKMLEGQMDSDEAHEEIEQPRSESPPPLGYNRKRETSSTTSSASGVARNSTAATSITSQSATKDAQSAPASAVTSPLERSATRTRRLYEQGLPNEKHEQPGSVLARIENLNRQRAFGTRTPDHPHAAPRAEGSADRFANNRALFSKASAPNLRSISPTAVRRSTPSPDVAAKAQTDSSHGGFPPLAPSVRSVSETSKQPSPTNDLGKATPLGIFQKPTERYNESQYVQRQRQLQQGRETPTQRHRSESQDTPAPKPDEQETKPEPSPEDSPTLGPAAGLSGLVRAHLRTESVDSDGAGIDLSGSGSRFNLDSGRPSADGSRLNSDLDWIRSHYGNSLEPTLTRGDSQSKHEPLESRTPDRTSTATEGETDEFANQLADARRRVREKLTSYVESDSSRATSPLLLPVDSPNLPAQTSNPLGILKPKTSRGSLIDRSRNMVSGQSKGLKILGLGGSTGAPPQPAKQSFEDKEFPSLETMKEEAREDTHRDSRGSEPRMSAESNSTNRDEDAAAHPGLRAFRQARRELQRRKELETLARHQASQMAQYPDQLSEQPNGMHSARTNQGPGQRTPSRERRAPPVAYRQPPSDEHGYSPNGARPSGERSRSGSETSGTHSGSRPPPRLRTNTNGSPHDQLGPPNAGRPMMRSPNMPGAEMKGSPMMPPYQYQGRGGPAPSPHLERSRSNTNLAAPGGPHSGQPSPISPMAPFAMGPPGLAGRAPTLSAPAPRPFHLPITRHRA